MNTLPTSFKEMKRATIMLFFSLLFGVAPTAKAQTLTIGSVKASAAPEVVLPVTGANLLNIGSITLFITFDSTLITYLSLENVDPQLNGLYYSLNSSPFQLAIVWSSVNPVEFLQKKLFDIRFAFKGEATPVIFKPTCEISNNLLQILPVNYISGSVTSGIPQITLQPTDILLQNKPNPVNGFTFIEYTLPDNGIANLEIFDLCGNFIAKPVSERQAKGTHKIYFNASGLKSGFYFYRLNFNNESSSFTVSRKLLKQNN